MKKVLCYGDSNTFGFNPYNGSRFDEKSRWSAILKNMLKQNYEIIEQGCNNRTGFVENSNGIMQSGLKYFPKCLEKYQDLDTLILSVGTNDLQFLYNDVQIDIENGLKKYISIFKNQNPLSQIIIIPPVKLKKFILKSYFSSMFDENSVKKSQTIGHLYEKVTQETNCKFFDFNEFVESSEIDGLHYDKNSHIKIAQEISKLFI